MFKVRIIHKGLFLVGVPLVFGMVFASILCLGLAESQRIFQHELLLKDALITANVTTRCTFAARICAMSYIVSQNKFLRDNFKSNNKEASASYSHLQDLLKTERTLQIPPKMSSKEVFTGDPSHLARMHSFMTQLERSTDRETREAINSVNALQIMLVCGMVASALITVVLAVFFCLNITRRLFIIVNNTMSLSKGAPLNAPMEGSDEIAELDQFLYKSASEIKELERFKKEIIGVVSHELKSPLSSVEMFLASLRAGVFGELNIKAQDKVERTHRNVVRLMGLVKELLYLDRLELAMRLEPTSSNEIITIAVDSVRELADRSDISLVVKNTGAKLQADRSRLVQVVTNLLTHAIKFSPSGSEVVVETKLIDGWFECRISDQGRGIPREISTQIFEPFQQIGSQSATSRKGTGLGLTISRAIVEQHDGKIGVECSEGRGSTFWFKVPTRISSQDEALELPTTSYFGIESVIGVAPSRQAQNPPTTINLAKPISATNIAPLTTPLKGRGDAMRRPALGQAQIESLRLQSVQLQSVQLQPAQPQSTQLHPTAQLQSPFLLMRAHRAQHQSTSYKSHPQSALSRTPVRQAQLQSSPRRTQSLKPRLVAEIPATCFSVMKQGLIIISVPLIFQFAFVAITACLLDDVREHIHREQHSNEVLNTVNRMSEAVAVASNYGMLYLYTHAPSHLKDWQEGKKNAFQLLEHLRALSANEAVQQENIKKAGVSLIETSTLIDTMISSKSFADSASLNEPRIDKPGLRSFAKSKSPGLNELRTGEPGPHSFAKSKTFLTSSASIELIKPFLEGQAAQKGLMNVEKNLGENLAAKRANLLSTVETVLAAALCLNILISTFLAVYLMRKITSRLQHVMANVARLVKRQPLENPKKGGDEIAILDQTLFETGNRLVELERLKRELVAVVSHELRTPLMSTSTDLKAFGTGTLGMLSTKAHSRLQIAQEEASRLIRLVNDLLDIEKMEAGKFALQMTELNLAELVKASTAAVAPLAELKRIKIETTLPATTLVADRDRLCQVLINLLSNAIKFSPAEATIKISVETRDSQIKFRVVDRGRGVPAELQKFIFDRFVQVKKTDGVEQGGSGLGLAIAKAIVEQHSGTIGVQSQLDCGSEFWFTLPLGEGRHSSTTSSTAASQLPIQRFIPVTT